MIPAVTKLLERITLNRMESTLYGEDGLIPKEQQGFRPGAGTTDQLGRFLAMGETALAEEVLRRKNGTKPGMRDKTYVGLIDMRAAYDKVDRQVLLGMMRTTSIPGEVTEAVAKIMKSTSFSVPVDSDENKRRPG